MPSFHRSVLGDHGRSPAENSREERSLWREILEKMKKLTSKKHESIPTFKAVAKEAHQTEPCQYPNDALNVMFSS